MLPRLNAEQFSAAREQKHIATSKTRMRQLRPRGTTSTTLASAESLCVRGQEPGMSVM